MARLVVIVHNFDRGMIKWMPFNSVISGKKMINDIINEKNKIKMPILSEEQKRLISENLVNAFYENIPVKVDYYFSGKILTINDHIKKIDFTYHKIYFDHKTLILNQIIKVD